jgi:hypothetical protein
MNLDEIRITALLKYLATQPLDVREAFILGQVYSQACAAHDSPFLAPEEDIGHLEWLRDYETRKGLCIIDPS